MAYKASKKKAADSSRIVPAGVYTVALKKAEKKMTQSGSGAYLAMEFVIVKPKKYKKRRVFENLNLDNMNEQAVEIAERLLNQLMLAAGMTVLDSKWDVSPLYGIKVKARIGIEEDKQYGPKNRIRGFIFDEADEDIPF